MSSLRISTLVAASLTLMLCATGAFAQYDEFHHEPHPGTDVPTQDTTVLPLIIPEESDFAPVVDGDGEKAEEEAGAVGGSANVDYSSYYKAGSLAPSYKFSKDMKARLRIPMIFNRTIEYPAPTGDATTSGLGDISLDMEYKRELGGKGQLLRFTGTVKFPTGDNEAMDNDRVVPLGTGSMDLLGRLQYSRSTKKMGLIGSALYRVNSSGEAVSGGDWGTATTETTNGNLFVLSGFGRYHAQGPWWIHFGISMAFTGDGEQTYNYTPNGGTAGIPTESVIPTKSTLIDIFPGVSYDLGLIKPFLGVRIPVSSSYDLDDAFNQHLDRETSVVLQFSYNPKSMTRD